MRTKSLLVTIFSILLPAISLAGSSNGWIYQNPYPTSNTLLAVKFVTPMKGWIAGEKGAILYTADGGDTWEAQESGTEADIKSIVFVNEKRGWAVGNGGTIIHTEDGGKTWAPQGGNETAALNKVFFVNEKEGWAVGMKGLVLHTTDSGKKWEKQDIGITRAIASVYFINQKTGWILAGDEVYRTTDGGKKWKNSRLGIKIEKTGTQLGRFKVIGMDGIPNEWWEGDIFFVNNKAGWAITGFNDIFYSADGGETWMTQYSNKYELDRVFFVNESKGCAIGTNLFCTEDGGQIWKDNVRPIKGRLDGFIVTLWGIDFVNQKEGWAVGVGGLILKTEDGGKSWRIKSRGGATYSHYFYDGKTGWAAKMSDDLKGSSIVRTDNGGDTWEVQKVFDTLVDIRFFFVNPTTGWAVGWQWEQHPKTDYTVLNSFILHSTDGGKTWVSQFNNPGSELALFDVHFANQNNGWVVGSKGTILYTNDGGKQWIRQDSDTVYRLEGVQFIDENRGWAVGVDGGVIDLFDSEDRKVGVVVHTEDGGRHWRQQLWKFGVVLHGLFFVDKDNGWVTGRTDSRGEHGRLFNTQDGGKTWKEKDMKEDRPGNIFFIDNSRGWAELETDDIGPPKDKMNLITGDGGKTWSRQKPIVHKYPWRYFEPSAIKK